MSIITVNLTCRTITVICDSNYWCHIVIVIQLKHIIFRGISTNNVTYSLTVKFVNPLYEDKCPAPTVRGQGSCTHCMRTSVLHTLYEDKCPEPTDTVKLSCSGYSHKINR